MLASVPVLFRLLPLLPPLLPALLQQPPLIRPIHLGAWCRWIFLTSVLELLVALCPLLNTRIVWHKGCVCTVGKLDISLLNAQTAVLIPVHSMLLSLLRSTNPRSCMGPSLVRLLLLLLLFLVLVFLRFLLLVLDLLILGFLSLALLICRAPVPNRQEMGTTFTEWLSPGSFYLFVSVFGFWSCF
jgi:hypothetical protein